METIPKESLILKKSDAKITTEEVVERSKEVAWRVSVKELSLKFFTKFTDKYLFRSLFLASLQLVT